MMAFAAEEVGLRGSRSIASNYRSKGYNIIGMLNFDMVGYKDNKTDLFIYIDDTNREQNSFLEKLIENYMPDISVAYSRCGSACSDHHSWHVEQFPASYVSDSKLENPPPGYHTKNDKYVSKEHIGKFAKLAVLYLSEHAKLTYPIKIKRNDVSKSFAGTIESCIIVLLVAIEFQRNL